MPRESIVLTDGPDNFTDVPGRSTNIYGKAGDDIIYGEDMDDDINGGEGDDQMYGGGGNDSLEGGPGSNFVFGGSGDDFLMSFHPDLENPPFRDWYYGEEGNDLLVNLTTKTPNGTYASFVGGVGDDTYQILNDKSQAIIEKAGEGLDTLIFYVRWDMNREVTLPDNVENLIISEDPLHELFNVRDVVRGTGNALDNVMKAVGPALRWIPRDGYGNWLVGLDEAMPSNYNSIVILEGLAGNDTLTGTNRHSDELYGGSGNDTLTGLAGDDILDGGMGNDIFQSASIPNFVSSGSDSDKLIGGKGDDIYYADTSDKIIENKHEGFDTLFAVPKSNLTTDFYVPDNVENMTIMDPDYAVTGTVYFDGYGNDQRNTIEGNSRDNALFGNGGNDLLIGGDGDDELDGGKGRDRYDGGAGNDQFIYDPADFRGEDGKGENAGTEGTVGLSSSESNSLRGKGAETQYSGGTGTDSLVLPIASPNLDLTKLADNRIRGIDVIEAEPVKGGAASLTLSASDVIAISDNGTLRIEDGFGAGILSVYSKNQGWTLSGTAVIDNVSYEVYKVGQATLVVDADLGGVIS